MGFAASSMYPGRYVHTMYQRPASYVALGNVASRLSSSGIATWTISSRPPRVVITWGQWRLGSGWLATLVWPRCGGCCVGEDCLCWLDWHCRRRLMLAFGPRLHLHYYWLCDSLDMQPFAETNCYDCSKSNIEIQCYRNSKFSINLYFLLECCPLQFAVCMPERRKTT